MGWVPRQSCIALGQKAVLQATAHVAAHVHAELSEQETGPTSLIRQEFSAHVLAC